MADIIPGDSAMTGRPVRTFPSDEQVDDWLRRTMLSEDDPALSTHEMDQLKAATRDSERLVHGVEGAWLAAGIMDSKSHVETDGPINSITRMNARMILAARSVGVKPMCPHTNQIRPLFMQCDPPVIFCFNCLPRVMPRVMQLGFFWKDICDGCGLLSATVGAVTSQLGHIFISAHLCPRCVRNT